MGVKRDNGPILITGCSSGLGHAAAVAFRNAGWPTVASARNINDLAESVTPHLDERPHQAVRAALTPRGHSRRAQPAKPRRSRPTGHASRRAVTAIRQMKFSVH